MREGDAALAAASIPKQPGSAGRHLPRRDTKGGSPDRQAILLAWKISPPQVTNKDPVAGANGPFGSHTRSRGRERGVLTRHDHGASSRLRPSDDQNPILKMSSERFAFAHSHVCRSHRVQVASSRLRRAPASTAFSSRSSRPPSAISTESAAAVVPPGEVTFWRKTDASSAD